jgi:hypothetical protein
VNAACLVVCEYFITLLFLVFYLSSNAVALPRKMGDAVK